MKNILAILLMILSFTSASNASQGDELLDKSIKALGGKTKLTSINHSTLEVMGLNSMTPDTSYAKTYYKGDAFKFINRNKADTSIIIWTGTNGWMRGNSFNSPNWSQIPPALQEQMSQFTFQRKILFSEILSNLPENQEVMFVGIDTVGTDLYNILDIKEVKNKEGLIFDVTIKTGKKDNLIYQYIISYYTGAANPNIVIEIALGDYREVSGVRLPHFVQINQGNQLSTLIYLDIDIESDVAPNLLANPIK